MARQRDAGLPPALRVFFLLPDVRVLIEDEVDPHHVTARTCFPHRFFGAAITGGARRCYLSSSTECRNGLHGTQGAADRHFGLMNMSG
jgi:hypothetical protein